MLESMLAKERFYCPGFYVFFNCYRTKFEVLIVNVCFSAKFQANSLEKITQKQSLKTFRNVT